LSWQSTQLLNMQVHKISSSHPIEEPSYSQMQDNNNELYTEREQELMGAVLLETLKKIKVSALFLEVVAKAVHKILSGEGYGEIKIEIQEGKIMFVRGTESIKIYGTPLNA